MNFEFRKAAAAGRTPLWEGGSIEEFLRRPARLICTPSWCRQRLRCTAWWRWGRARGLGGWLRQPVPQRLPLL